jgi:hypothetical protein
MAVSAAVLAAEPLLAWRAANWLEVLPRGADVFEVIGRAGSGAADYWCAAGDFARHQLGTPAVQRLYVWVPLGPSQARPGQKSVQFALEPPAQTGEIGGYSLTVSEAGENLTAAAARQYCLDMRRFDR